MNTLGNIIWLFFGGILIAFLYVFFSILLIITIIGIPFSVQTLKLAGFALLPFGKKVIATESASGCISVIMNIIWIFTGGISIAVSHLFLALIFAVTIIGLPFANQHIKLAGLAIAPFGYRVVSD
jgi:uncharacterized membrane protein YccF (DUF307 family)